VGRADELIQRRPGDANYAYLTSHSRSLAEDCAAILLGAPKHSCSIALVQSRRASSADANAQIEVTYGALSTSAAGATGKDDVVKKIAESELLDTDNSAAYTGTFLRSILARQSFMLNGTVVIAKDSDVDTSILVEAASSTQFVIEQHSLPETFARNMQRLRARRHSTKLSVFDFTPRTLDAAITMGVDRDLAKWRGFSKRIAESFSKLKQANVVEPRSRATLARRLADSRGTVVVLYAHADGDYVFLDTDDGVVKLSAQDISDIGVRAGGNLPPVILLNCEARAHLAPAFLDAGSPFVVASDKPLQVEEVANFMDHLARGIFREGRDVVDAYFNAQREAKPYRLRPIASARGPTPPDEPA
jgi:hypothetical protein